MKVKIKIFKDLYNILHFLNLLLHKKQTKDKNLSRIHFITFRKFFPEGGAGGGGAVQSANKVLFGNELNGITLKYSFYEDNRFSINRKNELWDLWGAIEFVYNKTKEDPYSAYITHDYGCAVGLALLGKKYALVSHIQGSRIEEKTNFGENFTIVSKLIIQLCEKIAFKNASSVCFPSYGAYEYFCNSKHKIINKNDFNFGGVLYNTLYAYPQPEIIKNYTKNINNLTILSVGQLTTAKGMDRHPDFIEQILINTNKNIEYIMVGQGPLENKIIENLNNLKKKYVNFEYKYIPRCTYNQMLYLQDICDIYLMLHRISIFDLTTLELMNKSKCIILSDLGGNPEFNKVDNIILVENKNYSKTVKDFCAKDIDKLGKQNKRVYDKYFSNENFIRQYQYLIQQLLNKENYKI